MNKEPDSKTASAPIEADYFATRRERVDFEAFDWLMSLKRGEKPRDGDEL